LTDYSKIQILQTFRQIEGIISNFALCFTMDQIRQIKAWISEINTGKKFHEDSILVGKHPAGGTQITFLEMACCRPSVWIQKKADDIDRQDIVSISHIINHSH